mgnify:CR=1 FL=1
MLGVFLLVLILQIIITQIGGAVFETVPLSMGLWGKDLRRILQCHCTGRDLEII